MEGLLILIASFLIGSIPFSQIAAKITKGCDLREVDSGTVSGTNLYKVAGFGPLALAGLLEVAKGAVGPLLAWGNPELQALAAGAAVVGHNWSPFLAGAGGRGVSVAMGALAVTAWPGAILLLLGMAAGRLIKGQTALGSFISYVLLIPVLIWFKGAVGAITGAAILVPMLLKRVLGNSKPEDPSFRVYATRFVLDRDPLTATEKVS